MSPQVLKKMIEQGKARMTELSHILDTLDPYTNPEAIQEINRSFDLQWEQVVDFEALLQVQAGG